MPVDKLTANDRERIAHARAFGAARAKDPSAIVDARYDAARDALDLEFRSGGVITIPRRVVPGLAGPRRRMMIAGAVPSFADVVAVADLEQRRHAGQ